LSVIKNPLYVNLTMAGGCSAMELPSPRKGVKLSERTRQRIRKQRAKQVITEKHKLAISKGLQGRVVSVETRKKISQKLKGRPSPMKGRTCTEEHTRNRVNSRLRNKKCQMSIF
jgi:hypothetical protein